MREKQRGGCDVNDAGLSFDDTVPVPYDPLHRQRARRTQRRPVRGDQRRDGDLPTGPATGPLRGTQHHSLPRGTSTSVAELRGAVRQFIIKAHNVETAKTLRRTASEDSIIAATNLAKQRAAT